MADYRRFQPRRSSSGSKAGLLTLGLAAVAVVGVILALVYGRNGSKNAEDKGPSIELVNDRLPQNGNTNVAADVQTDANQATSFEAVRQSCPSLVTGYGESKRVALTFDVVDDNDAVAALLERLKSKQIPGSFFITGNYASLHADLVKRISDAGFKVFSRGTSTASKYDQMKAATIAEDLTKAEQAITAAADGQSPAPFYRPSAGTASTATVAAVRSAGYCPIGWAVDSLDLEDTQTVDGAVSRVKMKVTNGSIVLLHAGTGISPDVSERLATELAADGYRLVTLEELLTSS